MPAAAERASGAAVRVRRSWRSLDGEQRLAAAAALALLGSMFLPWYEKSSFFRGRPVTDTISAFGAITFVEAAVFLVALGVLALLFARSERRPFHLPGGDGTVIMGAGLWAAFLIFYRVFDRPDVSGNAGTVGIQWGFFIAFIAAGALAYAGSRVRAAHRPEPPLGDDEEPPVAGATVALRDDDAPTRPLPGEERTVVTPGEVPNAASPGRRRRGPAAPPPGDGDRLF